MQDLDSAIRERAYYLWIGDGCPEGKADAYWLDAQRALLAASLSVPAAEAPAKAKPRKKSAASPKAAAKSSRAAA
jgi:hypothetical protein